MPQMVEVNCKSCGTKFEARVADRRRGWGKFCSKSCKAKKQGRKYPARSPLRHPRTIEDVLGYNEPDWDDDTHPFDSAALGQD